MNGNLKIKGYDEFVVTIGYDIEEKVIAKNHSSAKYKAFNKELSEFMTYEEFIKDKDNIVHVNKVRSATLSSLFMEDETLEYCRTYRNMPFLKLGMKAVFDSKEVLYVIGGADNVYCYNPQNHKIENYHPKYRMTYYDESDKIIESYKL